MPKRRMSLRRRKAWRLQLSPNKLAQEIYRLPNGYFDPKRDIQRELLDRAERRDEAAREKREARYEQARAERNKRWP